VITEYLEQTYQEKELWASVLHGRFADGAKELAQSLSERLNIKKMEILRISPVLGVHTGPGIVGAAVLPMELMADLTS